MTVGDKSSKKQPTKISLARLESIISGFMFIRISWHFFFVKSPPDPIYTPNF